MHDFIILGYFQSVNPFSRLNTKYFAHKKNRPAAVKKKFKRPFRRAGNAFGGTLIRQIHLRFSFSS